MKDKSTIWHEKWARQVLLYIMIGFTLVLSGAFFNRIGNWVFTNWLSFVLLIVSAAFNLVALLPLSRALILWHKARGPLFPRPWWIGVAFRRPRDRYLIGIFGWNIILVIAFVGLLITFPLRLPWNEPTVSMNLRKIVADKKPSVCPYCGSSNVTRILPRFVIIFHPHHEGGIRWCCRKCKAEF